MRRRLIAIMCMLVLSLASAPVLAIQDATPESPFADVGLPELHITVSASGYDGVPEATEAGRYLLSVTATEDTADTEGGVVAFLQPTTMTADEALALLFGMSDAEGATPAVDVGSDEEGIPEFVYQWHFAGGSYSYPGQTTQIVLDLTPGEWIVWSDDPAATQQPVILEVTGEMPADLPEPVAGATVTMGEYVIEITEGELTAGSQVIRIDNIGAQPHFFDVLWSTVPFTEEDVAANIEAEMTGTPPAVLLDLEADFEFLYHTGTQSSGTTIWMPVEMEAGTLLLLCFFPDISDQLPHLFHGMYNVVEVSG